MDTFVQIVKRLDSDSFFLYLPFTFDELASMNNVELTNMNNVELTSMNNVELTSMNNVELTSMNKIVLTSMNKVVLISMNNILGPTTLFMHDNNVVQIFRFGSTYCSLQFDIVYIWISKFNAIITTIY